MSGNARDLPPITQEEIRKLEEMAEKLPPRPSFQDMVKERRQEPARQAKGKR